MDAPRSRPDDLEGIQSLANHGEGLLEETDIGQEGGDDGHVDAELLAVYGA